jgi:hypothetical protein
VALGVIAQELRTRRRVVRLRVVRPRPAPRERGGGGGLGTGFSCEGSVATSMPPPLPFFSPSTFLRGGDASPVGAAFSSANTAPPGLVNLGLLRGEPAQATNGIENGTGTNQE